MPATITVHSVEGGFVGLVKAYFDPNILFLEILISICPGSSKGLFWPRYTGTTFSVKCDIFLTDQGLFRSQYTTFSVRGAFFGARRGLFWPTILFME